MPAFILLCFYVILLVLLIPKFSNICWRTHRGQIRHDWVASSDRGAPSRGRRHCRGRLNSAERDLSSWQLDGEFSRWENKVHVHFAASNNPNFTQLFFQRVLLTLFHRISWQVCFPHMLSLKTDPGKSVCSEPAAAPLGMPLVSPAAELKICSKRRRASCHLATFRGGQPAPTPARPGLDEGVSHPDRHCGPWSTQG